MKQSLSPLHSRFERGWEHSNLKISLHGAGEFGVPLIGLMGTFLA